MAVDAWMNKLAKNPTRFKEKIIIELENLVLLEMKVPKLLKTTDDKLA